MKRLQYERLQRGVSQESLARAARLHQTHVSQIERGVWVPGPIVLERLAAVLGVPADELLKPVAIERNRE